MVVKFAPSVISFMSTIPVACIDAGVLDGTFPPVLVEDGKISGYEESSDVAGAGNAPMLSWA